MKYRLILVVACVALLGLAPFNVAFGYYISSSADPALAGYSPITFEPPVPLGTYTTLAIGPVTFTAVDHNLSIGNYYAGQFNTTGSQYLDNESYSANGFNTMEVSFASPVHAVGFNFGASDTQWSLNAYNASNTLLESDLLPITNGGNSGTFVGIAQPGISYVMLVNDNAGSFGYDWIFVDNFYPAGSSTVPLPPSMLLFGSGLLGLVGWRRFKKS